MPWLLSRGASFYSRHQAQKTTFRLSILAQLYNVCDCIQVSALVLSVNMTGQEHRAFAGLTVRVNPLPDT